MSKLVVVDVESDGEYPPDFSMVCFGAVVVEPALDQTFYGRVKPLSANWKPEALAISGITRAEHETFDDPKDVMAAFANWLGRLGDRAIFVSDNPAYDFQWVNYYLHKFHGSNPFGYSGRNC